MVPTKLLIDAHLDLAWNALSFDRDLRLTLPQLRQVEQAMTDDSSRGIGTVSLPELRRAGVAACFGTLLARSGPDLVRKPQYRRIDADHADPTIAFATAQGQLAYYMLLQRQGHIRLIRTAAELHDHWKRCTAAAGTVAAAEPLGVVLSMEGADPIVEPEQLDLWWEQGLRAIGLSHFGRSQYAGGSGTEAPLSAQGLELLDRMQERGMILDVTHLSDRSLEEAVDRFGGTIIASHHNCRTLAAGQRQLPDDHIRRLVRRDAVIGVALYNPMLVSGWNRKTHPLDEVSLDHVAQHIDHICQLAGDVEHAAIGSDLDGGFGNDETPRELRSVADVPRLAEFLSHRHYSDAEIDAIFHGNWLALLSRALPA